MKKIIMIAALTVLGISASFAQKQSFVEISGSTNTMADGDSVKITVNKIGPPFEDDDPVYKVPILNHQFRASIPVGIIPLSTSIYFEEKVRNFKNANRLMSMAMTNYIIDRGDKLVITEQDGNIQFSGKGSKRFSLIQQLYNVIPQFTNHINYSEPTQSLNYFEALDNGLTEQLKILKQHRNSLTSDEYTLIEAEMIGGNSFKYQFLNLFVGEQCKTAFNSVKNYKSKLPEKYFQPAYFNNRSIIKYSSTYSNALRTKYIYKKYKSQDISFDPAKTFQYWADTYTGPLRERMLLNEIYHDREMSVDMKAQVEKALLIVKDNTFREKLELIRSNRVPGSTAFDFALTDTTGKIRRFSEFKGKVVLLDFWFTGCGGCLRVAPTLKKVEEHFRGKPVVFVTINTDKTKEIWMKNIRKRNYTSDYSTDLFTDELAFKSDIAKHYAIFSAPVLILVGKDGRLAVNPDFTDAEKYGVDLISAIDKELSK